MRSFIYLFLSLWLVLSACTNDKAGEGTPEMAVAQNNGKIFYGKVIGISDGDTFRFLTEKNETVRVRLYGIDAPEKGQDYSAQSQQKLSSLIFSKQVRVEQKNKDRYGRVVGIAFVAGLNVNEEMLRSGLVWHYRQYDKNEDWARLQNEAQRKKAGLWSMPSPKPPWEWRKEKREKVQEQPE